jgi:hypothetical protein
VDELIAAMRTEAIRLATHLDSARAGTFARMSVAHWRTEAEASRQLLKRHPNLPHGTGDVDLIAGLSWLRAGQRVFPTRPRPPSPRTVVRDTAFAIAGTDQQVVAVHWRTDFSDGSKRMWWARPDGALGLGDLAVEDVPLYGSHAWRPNRATIHVEGEKCRDALAPLADALNLNVVGHVTGPLTAPSADALRPILSPRHYLWPDADVLGEAHMTRIGATLRALLAPGITPAPGMDPVRVVLWRGARPDTGDDAADFAAGGGTAQDLAGLMLAGDLLLDETPEKKP